MSNKILDLLNTLSKEEWKLFERFIKSPYYTGNKDYYYIFTVLKNYFKNRDENYSITNSLLYQKILKRKKIEKHTFQNQITKFYKLTEKFITLRGFEKDKNQQLYMQLKEYSERNLPICFNYTMRSSKNLLKNNIYDLNRYFTLSKISKYSALFKQSNDNFKETTEEYYKFSEYEMIVFLDNLFHYALDFYLIKDFGFSIEFNLSQEIFNSLKIKSLIEKIERQNKWYFSSILIRYYFYSAFTQKDNREYINKAKYFFFKFKDYFSFDIYKEFYFILEKYYNDTNNKECSIELISLFKDRINKELFDETNKDNYGDEIRIAILKGLQYNEIEWVQKLINEFIPKLPANIKEGIHIISSARLYIHKNEFEKAYTLLVNKKFKKQSFIIDAYYLRIYVFFELSKYEEVFLEIDKLRHYAKKITINKINRDTLNLFILNLTRLLKITTSTSNAGLEDLYLNIERIKNPLFNKEWFFKKIEKLRIRDKKVTSRSTIRRNIL